MEPKTGRSETDLRFDLGEIRARLWACVDARTGTVDESALAKAEFDHNRCVARAVLQSILPRWSLGIDVICGALPPTEASTHHATTFVTRHEDGIGFFFHHRLDPSERWTDQEVADAISAASLMVHMVPSRVPCDEAPVFFRVQGLWDLFWMRVAVESLAAGPGADGWTAEAIDSTGAVLRSLIDIVERRLQRAVAIQDRPPPYAALCSDRSSALADALCESHTNAPFRVAGNDDLSRIVGVRGSLRGMLAWIDAMERTDAIFEHVLKPYQSDRIARLFADEPRFALP